MTTQASLIIHLSQCSIILTFVFKRMQTAFSLSGGSPLMSIESNVIWNGMDACHTVRMSSSLRSSWNSFPGQLRNERWSIRLFQRNLSFLTYSCMFKYRNEDGERKATLFQNVTILRKWNFHPSSRVFVYCKRWCGKTFSPVFNFSRWCICPCILQSSRLYKCIVPYNDFAFSIPAYIQNKILSAPASTKALEFLAIKRDKFSSNDSTWYYFYSHEFSWSDISYLKRQCILHDMQSSDRQR